MTLTTTTPPHLADRWRDYVMSPLNQNLTVKRRGIIRSTPARRKVCIYGAGMWKEEAPLNDPEWEVWALNLIPPFDAERRLRADVWFDLHQRVAQTADDLRWIRECPFPIYVPPDLEDASPNAVVFPLDLIEAVYGGYWACTFAYQIALAMRMGYVTDIGLYGVELFLGTARERTVEWACVAYWMGRAEQAGIRFALPAQSWMGCHPPGRYGFEYRREIDGVKAYTDRLAWGDERRRAEGDVTDVGG